MMRARLGPGLIEVQRYQGGRFDRLVLRDLDAALFLRADCQVSTEALEREFGDSDQSVADVRAAVERLETQNVLLRSGSNVVTTVPFSLPQTDESLFEWGRAHHLPVRRVHPEG